MKPLRFPRLAAWWRGLQPRERLMLGVMTAMIVAFVLWYGILLPARHFRDQAALDRKHATTALAEIRAIATTLDLLDTTLPPRPVDAAALRSAVSESARRAGLQLAPEHEPSGDALMIESEHATPRQLFGFLDLLRTRHGLSPTTLSAAVDGDQLRVKAEFTLPP